MTYALDEQTFLDLVEARQFDRIVEMVDSEHSADIAQHLETLEPELASEILVKIDEQEQASILTYFSPEFQSELGPVLGPDHLSKLMNLMPHDDRVDLIKQLELELQDRVLFNMARAEREDLRLLSSYPEGSAGSIMTTDYTILFPHLSVREALEKLRQEAPSRETINRAYVVDHERVLLGAVRLQDLIMAMPHTSVKDVMEESTHAVKLDDHQEFVANQVAKYDIVAIPVVDERHRLVGIVTHDDVVDVLKEEATEDFHRVGSVGEIDGNVRDVSMGLLYRKRITWLIVLVFGNLLTGMGIAFYEDVIAKYVALVFFMPLLIGSAGNAGSQSATLMVRALATGDVELKDWGYMLGKELIVALGLGLTMALAVSVVGVYRAGLQVAIVVSLTMVIVVMIGSLVGMSMPFLLSRFRSDPAMASAPLITTIADVSGVVIYLAVASMLLGQID
jgi:magnesium transporter